MVAKKRAATATADTGDSKASRSSTTATKKQNAKQTAKSQKYTSLSALVDSSDVSEDELASDGASASELEEEEIIAPPKAKRAKTAAASSAKKEPPARKNKIAKALAEVEEEEDQQIAAHGKENKQIVPSSALRKPKAASVASTPLTTATSKANSVRASSVLKATGTTSRTSSAIKASATKKFEPRARLTRPPRLEFVPETQDAYAIDEEDENIEVLPQQQDESGQVSSEAYRRLLAQHESLKAKFSKLSNLRETAAEAALTSYKSSAERRFAAADELITELRGELLERSRKIKQMESAVKDTSASEETVAKLNTTIQKLSQENSMLKAKFLTTSNTASSGGHPTTPIDKLKEDIISDLTGLIVRDVRKDGENVVFDCLQAGRNGAFHYKLLIPDADSGSGRYDDSAVTLVPMIDEKRDALLLSLLPDYFTESLTFMRNATAQCYLKISQALQKNTEKA
ncbi:chromosome segregation protein Csm1/Pcs1-domain-containing protein [Myxozyma melibiosi]|uniref:Chromosome segregation protein Csm1/Pcs1-domain-containing protein n=1 Tax=Myxozyma melibiosi TaxID=54550 RepID=A0ABR1FFC4_9ASCO